jgi:glycosyltransferase involved in cell wall biosynthesis
MHIAFWSPGWPLEKFQNGIVTYVTCMKRELERQGHKVSVFTQGPADDGISEPHVYRIRDAPRGLWRRAVRGILGRLFPIKSEIFDFSAVIAAEISRVHGRDPIDIIEMEESFGWFANVGRQTSIPLVVKLHGPAFLTMMEDELATSFGREKVEREGRALGLFAPIVSPSRATLTRTIDRYKLTPKETRHILNPLSMDSDTPLWSLSTCDHNVILFVGRFDLCKGADIVLKAFLSAAKDRPDLKLIFVGPDRGLPEPRGGRIQFAPYCDSLFPTGLRDRVDFRGTMGNREVAKLRTRAMVTVVASRWENSCYALLEAMFQGCPVVVTDAGGCPESMIDGVTGRLAKSENPDDYASQICAMLEDPKGAEAMGQSARRHVIEQHSVAKVATESLELYSKVIANFAR